MFAAVLAYLLVVVFFGLELVMRRGGQARSLRAGLSDRGTTILIGASFGTAILLPPILNYLSIGRFSNPQVMAAGVIVMLAGLVVRAWSMQTLGRFYTRTLLVLEAQAIVQTGPYRVIRHPGYLGTLLFWIGFPVALANWIAAVLVALFMAVAYGRRILFEEAMLVEQFGDEYRQYMKRTWRLLPYIF